MTVWGLHYYWWWLFRVTIKGKAGKDICLTAAENRKTAEGKSRSKGARITAYFGIGGRQNAGISVGKFKGNWITYTGSAAISKEIITITDKENREQSIEKLNRNTEDSLSKRKEIFDKTKVEEKQELIHMMNIVGTQLIHEAAGYYGWKEGSTEKLLLHEMRGAE